MDNNYTYEYLKKQTEDNLAHFIYQFSEKVINNEASLFIGAGVSRNSGYPGWADLLSECADDLNINSNIIDLYSLAQYYANKHSDAELRRIISQKINTLPKSNNLLNDLLEIDFNNIWTTNYDKLIEKGLEEKEKPYNVIFSDKNLSSIDKHDKQAAAVQGIKISFSNSVLSITMPGLLPKRKLRTNTAFLHEPLNLALQTYVTEHSIPLYKRCVVCFSQIYDQSLSLQRIRDYDNLEFKQILDTIASYVLVDDTGLFCDSYHTTELGNYDHTVIFVMEPEIFPGWLKNRKSSIKTISEIS